MLLHFQDVYNAYTGFVEIFKIVCVLFVFVQAFAVTVGMSRIQAYYSMYCKSCWHMIDQTSSLCQVAGQAHLCTESGKAT